MPTIPAKLSSKTDYNHANNVAEALLAQASGKGSTGALGKDLTVSIPISGRVHTQSPASAYDAPPFLYNLAQNLRTGLPLLIMDCVGLAIAMVAASFCAALVAGFGVRSLPYGTQLLTNGAVFVLVYGLLGLYPGVAANPIVELKHMVLGTLTAGLILLVASLTFGVPQLSEVVFTVALTGFSVILVPVLRCTSRELFSGFHWWGQPAIVIGSGDAAVELLNTLRRKRCSGLRPLGIMCDRGENSSNAKVSAEYLGSLDEIPQVASENRVFWALIAMSESGPAALAKILPHCGSIPNMIVVPRYESMPTLWSRTQDLGGVLGVHVRERLLSPTSQFCKRAFDILAVSLGCLVLLPFLVPLFLAAWVCIKRCSPGPMFYSQERVGKGGRRFRAWKFRTMVLNADEALEKYLAENPEMRKEWDVSQKLRRDPRIIPGIGHLLRKSSLDEIPQLWNVWIGDMSLVGPRPFFAQQECFYGDVLQLYQKVRPGITGLWQISGRNHTTFEDRVNYDAYYVRNWSLWLDIFILGRTVRTVLFREGAF
ncbi:undecaprenyl-phosphate galactose phosphotransferase WbaP [Planctomicrobium piriforme]|uniref:Undecaprenyl-phosphate galactose phosphotransferase, WbaP/exopolysaccharide biosynthesis polyprenyl glycosylphosphotransferase n=1 Tax=Planctomicrobium piriforme TaxID=1576369 RepID=A0A1I3DBW3_9PLAN|nr:undecaprenyl-phosphate galactose phosphotransferase WbaP [Planctomicrobium piriforme]SFH83981.1 Undecaprenyl-phosphate galactose phosphotransferase, WbaP/exopolysaccharide biosynthesis polyprenyl glycosylphosphotransferase [Planctomicrobium piriforme]